MGNKSNLTPFLTATIISVLCNPITAKIPDSEDNKPSTKIQVSTPSAGYSSEQESELETIKSKQQTKSIFADGDSQNGPIPELAPIPRPMEEPSNNTVEVPQGQNIKVEILPDGRMLITYGDTNYIAIKSQDYKKNWDSELQDRSLLRFPWPSIPSDFDKRPLLGVIDNTASSRGPASTIKVCDEKLLSDPRLVLDRSKVLSSRASIKLSLKQQQDLLSIPSLTLVSRYAPHFFRTKNILILSDKQNGNYSAILADLATMRARILYAPINFNSVEAHTFLIDQALKAEENQQVQQQVIVDKDGGKYHPLGTHDIEAKDVELVCDSESQAESLSYVPCPNCYDLLDNNDMEQAINIPEGASDLEQSFQQPQDGTAMKILHDKNFDTVYERLVEDNGLVNLDMKAYILADDDYCAFAYYSRGPLFITEGLYRILDTPGELAAALSRELACSTLGYINDSRAQYFDNPSRPWIMTQKTRNELQAVATMRSIYSYMDILRYATNSRFYWGYIPSYVVGPEKSDYSYFETSAQQTKNADRLAIQMCYIAGYDPEEYRTYVKKIAKLTSTYDIDSRGDINMWILGTDISENRFKALDDIVKNIQDIDAYVKAITNSDPALAHHIRTRVGYYLENPQKLKDFDNAYKLALPLE